jgi:ABC-type antimicrobial peptide transport system permease subunit
MVFYIPYRQDMGHLLAMVAAVRTAGDPLAVATRIRQELRDIDSSLPVLRITTIDDQLNFALAQERMIASLSGFFGVVAVLLAGIGLFGVVAQGVARRTKEIGIRMALGATRAGVRGMVLRESLWLVLMGIAIGLPATLASARFISNRLFGVTAMDPRTLALASSLMLMVALLAGFFPARRASRVDPIVAIRSE